MKRAVILISVLTAICVTGSVAVDLYEARTAQSYLDELPPLRMAILNGDMTDARDRESLMYARWQHDAAVLNIFISHHHTRLVSTALLQLSTAVEMGWQEEALKTVDLLQDALEHVLEGDFYKWENFF
jgi:hypothetical protein